MSSLALWLGGAWLLAQILTLVYVVGLVIREHYEERCRKRHLYRVTVPPPR